MQFDLTTLPAGTVPKATLVLFARTVTTAGAVNISAADRAWSEATVVGNSNTPAALSAVAGGGSGLGNNAEFELRFPHHPSPASTFSSTVKRAPPTAIRRN